MKNPETTEQPVKIKKHLTMLLWVVAIVPMIIILLIFTTKVGKISKNQVTETLPGQIFECTEASRKIKSCKKINEPVCATVQIQCFTTPCDPIITTYENVCEACRNLQVSQYTEGKCDQ